MSDLQNFKFLHLIFILILGLSVVESWAVDRSNGFGLTIEDCDVCGSISTSSGAVGLLQSTNYIGLRFSHQSFISTSGVFTNSPKVKETISSLQVLANIPLANRYSISINAPFNFLSRDSELDNENIHGIGDFGIMGWYELTFDRNTIELDKIPNQHKLRLGLGIKAPTGEFEERHVSRVNPGFQLGTGSWDFQVASTYTLSSGKIGFSTALSYTIKTENKNEYSFGNEFNATVTTYYSLQLPNALIKPFASLNYKHHEQITQYNQRLPETNGHLSQVFIGSELSINRMTIGGQFAIPIEQNLFAEKVEANNQFSVYVYYTFN